MKNKEKKGLILLILITLLVLYISLKDNFFEVIIGLTKLNPFWILMGIIFVFGYYFFRSLSLYNFTKEFKKDINFFEILKMVLITQFFDGITPSSSGGQPYQIYALNKQKINIVDTTNITIQNFIVYQIALILIGLISVLLNIKLQLFQGLGTIKHLIIIGFTINILVVIALFSLAFMKKLNKSVLTLIINLLSKLKIIKNKKEITENINKYIQNFHDGALILIKNKKNFIKTILYNLLSLLLIYMVPAIIIYGLGNFNNVNPMFFIISSSYVMLIGTFIPIPGGTGGIEYAFVKFYSIFISGPTLTLVMLLWRFLTYYLGVIVGAILLNIRKKR